MLASKDAQNEEDKDEDHDDFTTVLPAKSFTADKSGVTSEANGTLKPIDIDAFWLQRQISNLYSDALTAQQKTEAALDILQRYFSGFYLNFSIAYLLLVIQRMI